MTREYWEKLIGSTVCGSYLVRGLIGYADETAVFLVEHGQRGAQASLKLVPAEDSAYDVSRVDHPHIIQLLGTGNCEIGGASFRYFLTETADENLGTVVAARALSPDEVRELLPSVLDALAYLHERGLAHSAVIPSNICAVGNSVKLSADSIRLAGAVASESEDMRSLGLTIIEVLTQERQPSAIAGVPQPFRDIVEHSLQLDPAMQWTARQAALRLSGVVPVAAGAVSRSADAEEGEAPPAQPVSARPASPIAASNGHIPGHTDKTPSSPSPYRVPAGSLSPSPSRVERKRPVPIWVLAVAAALLVLVIVLLAHGTGSSAASVSPAASVPPAAGTPVPQAPVVTRQVPPPSATARPPVEAPVKSKPTPFNAPPKATPPVAAHAPANARGWFVVTASYSRQADAEHKAAEMARRFPQFKPTVFPPSPIDTHYLVIIGSGLSQPNADALRQRAVTAGLPADTYIKAYPSSRR